MSKTHSKVNIKSEKVNILQLFNNDNKGTVFEMICVSVVWTPLNHYFCE